MEVQPLLGLQLNLSAEIRQLPRDGLSYVGVPMKLAEPAWLEPDERRRERLAGGKVCRVDFVKLAPFSRHRLRLVLQRPVHERGIAREVSRRCWRDLLGANSAVEDARVRFGDIVKDGRIQAKVLGDNISRGMRDPVVNVERRADLVKVGVIKYQKELVLLAETLDRMGHPLWEVPDVSDGLLVFVPPWGALEADVGGLPIVERLDLITAKFVNH